MSTPVAATRCPTYGDSLSILVPSTIAIADGRLFKKPDFQLRVFGASAPDVSFSQNVPSSFARHPVIVTDGTFCTAAFGVGSAGNAFGGSIGAGFDADSTAGAVDEGATIFGLADSTGVVLSIDAFAGEVRGTLSVAAGFDATGFFVSGRVGAVTCCGAVTVSSPPPATAMSVD
jgi:hypothetical protein